jgi:ketosteroid isomerase-like protein
MAWTDGWMLGLRVIPRLLPRFVLSRVVLVMMAILIGGLAVSASAQDPDAAARDQVLALEKAWNQAYKAGDTKALASILDNSLVLVEDDGSLKTKFEFLASIKSSTANQEQVAPESLSVRVFGNTAIAIGVIAVKETKGGKAVTHKERFIDTWINKDGKWVCIATNATPMLHGQ